MLKVGDRVAIKVAGQFSVVATHEIVGSKVGYGPLICPINRLGDIEPGQITVPVTAITEDRIEVRS